MPQRLTVPEAKCDPRNQPGLTNKMPTKKYLAYDNQRPAYDKAKPVSGRREKKVQYFARIECHMLQEINFRAKGFYLIFHLNDTKSLMEQQNRIKKSRNANEYV